MACIDTSELEREEQRRGAGARDAARRAARRWALRAGLVVAAGAAGLAVGAGSASADVGLGRTLDTVSSAVHGHHGQSHHGQNQHAQSRHSRSTQHSPRTQRPVAGGAVRLVHQTASTVVRSAPVRSTHAREASATRAAQHPRTTRRQSVRLHLDQVARRAVSTADLTRATATAVVAHHRRPAVDLPFVDLPAVKLPAAHVPSVTLPSVALPSVALPSVTLPSVTLPSVNLPSVALPAVEPGAAHPHLASGHRGSHVEATSTPGVRAHAPQSVRARTVTLLVDRSGPSPAEALRPTVGHGDVPAGPVDPRRPGADVSPSGSVLTGSAGASVLALLPTAAEDVRVLAAPVAYARTGLVAQLLRQPGFSPD